MTEADTKRQPDLLDIIEQYPNNRDIEGIDSVLTEFRGVLADLGAVVPTLAEVTPSVTKAPTLGTKSLRKEKDMLAVFGCEGAQVAHTIAEIGENTRAYVGSLIHYDDDGKIIPIFQMIGHLEHIYRFFPDRRIRHGIINIDGKTAKQLEDELDAARINISPYARDMLRSSKFTTGEPRILHTLSLAVQDLELSETPTTKRVFERIEALGGELLPGEAGPHWRRQDTNQPLGDWYYIAMEQIETDRRGSPHVFSLARREGGFWLHDVWAGPDALWSPEDQFVFSLRK